MNDDVRAAKTLTLSDGRRLGYAEYGDPAGLPVLMFHGTPGSRLCRHPDEQIAVRLGARVITVDRPGYGLSDHQPGRTLLDWPGDVAQLADALQLPAFAVAGISGGGPYAAAVAHALPDRVTRAALICSPAPFEPGLLDGYKGRNRLVFALAAKFPWLLQVLVGMMARQIPASAERLAAQLRKSMPPCDGSVVELPGVAAMFLADTQEAFRAGIDGAVRDLRLTVQPWGFDPASISVPTMLWHGELDANVPVEMGRSLAEKIPGCEATFVPGAGHLVYVTHWEPILSGLLA